MLKRVSAALEGIPAGASCGPCADCSRHTLIWSVGRNGRGGDVQVDDRCLAERPEFSALYAAFQSVEGDVSATLMYQ